MSIYQKLFDIQGLSVKKDAKNPFFKCKYATLEKIMELLEPILQKNNWLILHTTHAGSVTTILKDLEHNEEVVSAIHLPELQDPQKIGSAITYFRRYNIVQIFNLLTEDDDDGNFAAAPTYPKTPEQVQEQAKEVFEKKELGKCKDCGADNNLSKQGKTYCSDTCWLKKK